MEFDVLDTVEPVFLEHSPTEAVLQDVAVVPVRILYAGSLRTQRELTDLVGPSRFMSDSHLSTLHLQAQQLSLDADRTMRGNRSIKPDGGSLH